MADCTEYIVIPTLPNDDCQGERVKTGCVYSPNAYTLLGLPINSTQEQINNALVQALNSALTTNSTQQTIIEDLEQRVYNLENP